MSRKRKPEKYYPDKWFKNELKYSEFGDFIVYAKFRGWSFFHYDTEGDSELIRFKNVGGRTIDFYHKSGQKYMVFNLHAFPLVACFHMGLNVERFERWKRGENCPLD